MFNGGNENEDCACRMDCRGLLRTGRSPGIETEIFEWIWERSKMRCEDQESVADVFGYRSYSFYRRKLA